MNTQALTILGTAGIGIVIALQTWVLKEIYSLRIATTRAEERHILIERRLSELEHARS